jgi:hypothetical protein
MADSERAIFKEGFDSQGAGYYYPVSTPAGPLPQGMLSLGAFFFWALPGRGV